MRERIRWWRSQYPAIVMAVEALLSNNGFEKAIWSDDQMSVRFNRSKGSEIQIIQLTATSGGLFSSFLFLANEWLGQIYRQLDLFGEDYQGRLAASRSAVEQTPVAVITVDWRNLFSSTQAHTSSYFSVDDQNATEEVDRWRLQWEVVDSLCTVYFGSKADIAQFCSGVPNVALMTQYPPQTRAIIAIGGDRAYLNSALLFFANGQNENAFCALNKFDSATSALSDRMGAAAQQVSDRQRYSCAVRAKLMGLSD